MRTLAPGHTIGIIGGGQLARMLSIAAAQLGYRCHIYAPEASGPAADVSARWTSGAYDDADALSAFAHDVDVVTYEFENVDCEPPHRWLGTTAIFPSFDALRTAQDRAVEKNFAAHQGAQTAPWQAVDGLDSLVSALDTVGAPAILKTRRFGYDGYGQARIAAPDDALAAWERIGGAPAILEGFVDFEEEFSVLIVRGQDGQTMTWDLPRNVHVDGTLSVSTVPATAAVMSQSASAIATARRIADALDYVGVLTLEFFVGKDGPIFNEMAPRVHNSGHWTIEGAVTSQFENHIRAICGLPLGDTRRRGSIVTMTNLIGEQSETWPRLVSEPGAHVHLYGKAMRPGRKMGHVTRVSE